MHATEPARLYEDDPALRPFWHPVGRSEDIGTTPLAVGLLGEHVAVVRLDGELVAFPDRCPHRLAPLSAGRVVGREWQCGYHGWRFDGGGRCTAIPALGPDATVPPRAHLRPVHVVERHGIVWLSLDAPHESLLEIPEATDPAFRAAPLPAIDVAACAGSLIDNFLDVAHFPFVHAATFGGGAARQVDPPEVEPTGAWSFRAVEEQDFDNHEDPAVASGARPLRQRRRATYAVHAPYTATLRLENLDQGATNTILFAVQPVARHRCRILTTLFRDDCADEATAAQAAAYEAAVIAEDLVVQRLLPQGFPLEPTAEVHTRADRVTLEYRRMLARLAGRR